MVGGRSLCISGAPVRGWCVRTASSIVRCTIQPEAWSATGLPQKPRSKPGGETRDLKDRLEGLADDVLAQRVTLKVSTVATQVIGTYSRF